jgi:hypothetical protein
MDKNQEPGVLARFGNKARKVFSRRPTPSEDIDPHADAENFGIGAASSGFGHLEAARKQQKGN